MSKSRKTLLVSALICLLIFTWSVITPLSFRESFSFLTKATFDIFGDFYLILGFGMVTLLVILAILPPGNIRLGTSAPSYSVYAWVAMLFSTGMGPGLMLRAVQEPTYYFLNPPNDLGYDPVSYSLAYTFFHWGFTPWAFYALFGLIIAFFIYVKGKRLLPSAVLTQKLNPAIGIDTLIIICTIMGVVSSVGLGSRQLLDGSNYLLGTNFPVKSAILIVLFIVTLSIISARSGLSKSIKIISTVNLSVMLSLLLFVLLQNDLSLFFKRLIEATTIYLKDFAPMSLNIGNQKVSRDFLIDWTYFYWAYWLAWVPFTGVFIARISKGRSIRQFVLGTLITPSIGTFFWFTAFGQKALNAGLSTEELSTKYESIYSAIFIFFKDLPLDQLTNPLALVLLFTFLITSIDSAIFVLSMFSDDGSQEPNQTHRLVWGLALGGLTAGLLIVGQESLLKATSQVLIVFALPFSFLYLWFVFYFIKSLFKHSKNHD